MKKLEGADAIRDGALTMAINTTAAAIGQFGILLRAEGLTSSEQIMLASDIREMTKSFNMMSARRRALRGVN